MKTFFTEHLKFNKWANDRLFAFIGEHDLQNSRINPIASHLTLEQVIWCDRLMGKVTPTKVNEWAAWPWEEIIEKCEASSSGLIEFVAQNDDSKFNEQIEYINTSGTPHSRSVSDILTHVGFYTSFHRGQITALIHQEENMITPSLEYVDFVKS